jgi:hypothetical protein
LGICLCWEMLRTHRDNDLALKGGQGTILQFRYFPIAPSISFPFSWSSP